MPYYSLFVEETGETRSGIVAQSREEAMAKFGEQLGRVLTLDDQDIAPPYLLGERRDPEGWVPQPDIPVFDAPD